MTGVVHRKIEYPDPGLQTWSIEVLDPWNNSSYKRALNLAESYTFTSYTCCMYTRSNLNTPPLLMHVIVGRPRLTIILIGANYSG